MTETPLRCPFCGSEHCIPSAFHLAVECQSCKAIGPKTTSPEHATHLWNTVNYQAVDDRHRLVHMRSPEAGPFRR